MHIEYYKIFYYKFFYASKPIRKRHLGFLDSPSIWILEYDVLNFDCRQIKDRD